MKKIEIRPDGSKRVYTVNLDPSMADPSWKDDCDVNIILQKFMKTGSLNHLAKRAGQYADVSEIPDLAEALMQVQRANEAFELVPAEIRARLDNDPVKFIEYLNDPKNDPEAIKLGFKKPKDPPTDGTIAPESSVNKKPKDPPTDGTIAPESSVNKGAARVSTTSKTEA